MSKQRMSERDIKNALEGVNDLAEALRDVASDLVDLRTHATDVLDAWDEWEDSDDAPDKLRKLIENLRRTAC